MKKQFLILFAFISVLALSQVPQRFNKVIVTGDITSPKFIKTGSTSDSVLLGNGSARSVNSLKTDTVSLSNRINAKATGNGTANGTNTGDETLTSIKTKLGITTLSGANTGDQTTVSGNAGTATKLQTSRTINGVAFDGTQNITVNAVDATPRVASSLLRAPNGVATLDANGIILITQLPSYIDDVLEYDNLAAFPGVGETGKIYVAKDTNKTYRWSGSIYIYITSGAVDSVNGYSGVVSLSKSDLGLGSVDNTSDANKPISSATQTALNGKQPAGNYSTDIHSNITALNAVSNTNTGDETLTSIKTKLGAATAVSDGYLKYQDWSIFNSKEPAFSKNTGFNLPLGTTPGTVLEGRTFGTAANSAVGDFVPMNPSYVRIGSTIPVTDEVLTISIDGTANTSAINIKDRNVSANSSAFMVFRKSDDAYLGNIRRSGTDNALYVGGNDYIALGTGNTERFRINSTGAATFSSTVYSKGFDAYRTDGGTGLVVNGGDLGSASVIASFNDYSNNPKVYIDGRGVLASNVATGTAPLTVNSTTMVGNLNADLLDGYHASAFQPIITGLSTNYIPKWNGSNFVNSLISDDGNRTLMAKVVQLNDNYQIQWTNSTSMIYGNGANGTINLTGNIRVDNGTSSTSPTSGALVVNGGVGANHVRANNFYGNGSNLTGIQLPITLTTNGTSGVATFSGNVLNVPNYTSSGGVNQTQTTVNGSTGGSAICSMPFQTGSYKKVMIRFSSLSGNASYSYPTVFTTQPSISSIYQQVGTPGTYTTGGAGASAFTITGASGLSGWIFIEGY